MVNRKLALFLVCIFAILTFIFPASAKAFDLQDITTAGSTLLVRIQENVEYFFAFKTEQKIAVLEKQAEKRLDKAQQLADQDQTEGVQNQIEDYLQIKERQDNLLADETSDDVLNQVRQRTIDQQQTMEQIKGKIGDEQKRVVVQAQEQVVNQVAQRVIDKDGSNGATEFFQEVEHVWAPGTGPGGESGVVIEGGKMQFAPGTSAGGPSGVDVQNVVIEGGGGSGETKVEGGQPGLAPGTSSGGNGSVVVEEQQ
jgi:O6-methylguanine-DNA--protein-cysteine methyltransferase